MFASSHPKISAHRFRREVMACLGVFAVLFQLAMPFASAFAAQSGDQPTEVICTIGGQLIGVGGEHNGSGEYSAACEFCLVCQFAVFGHINAPKFSEHRILFTQSRIIWSGALSTEFINSSDHVARPVRAPPAFV
jgi:hypothetical protein